MKIAVEVFGTLRDKLPGEDGRGKGTYEFPASATIDQVFRQLGVPVEMRCIVMVNGKQETDRSRTLSEGDKLTVMPPVAGGGKNGVGCMSRRVSDGG